MARIVTDNRVQTQDLPTRGLRPANVSAGQYRVAVQQAPESKLIGLARGLSSVNRGLEAYTQMGGTLNEMYEEEIQGLSFAQLEKQKQAMEKRLDKSVRDGKIPFLGNPLNWERSQRALAKEYAARLHDRVTSSGGRFQGGAKQGDNQLTVGQILDEERGAFLAESEVSSLQANPIMMQAFNQEWSQRSRQLQQRYSDQKTKEMLAGTTRSAVNSIVAGYDKMREAENDKDLSSSQKLEAEFESKQAILSAWGDLNALKPADQLRVIRGTAKLMAETDPSEAAEFLEFAKKSLSVGSRMFSDESATIREIENIIAKEQDVGDNQELKDLREDQELGERKANNDLAAYTNLEARIKKGEQPVWRDQALTSTQQLKQAFNDYAIEVGGIHGDVIMDGLEKDLDRDPQSLVSSRIQQLADGRFNVLRAFSTEYGKYLNSLEVDEKVKLDANTMRQLSIDLVVDLSAKKQEIAGVLASFNDPKGYFTPEELATAQAESYDLDRQADLFNIAFKRAAEAEFETYRAHALTRQEQEAKAISDVKADEVHSRDMQAIRLDKYKGERGGKELAKAMLANLKVMANGEEEQRKLASENFWERYSHSEVQAILNKDKFKVEAKIDPEGVYTMPPVEYTEEDIQEFEKVYIQVQALSGALTNIHKMKSTDDPNVFIHTRETIDPAQGRFSYTTYPIDVTEINTRQHRILTQEEVESNDASLDSIKAKAERVGVTPDKLLENQREWYKEYSQFIQRTKQ